VKHGVVIQGPVNVTSMLPFYASQIYTRIVTNYFLHLGG
jgi:hypothetical protein